MYIHANVSMRLTNHVCLHIYIYVYVCICVLCTDVYLSAVQGINVGISKSLHTLSAREGTHAACSLKRSRNLLAELVSSMLRV